MKRLLVLVGIVMMLSLTGCGKFKEIKVNSVDFEKVSPRGLREVDVNVAVEIDNPACQIKLSDMEAVLKYSGKVLGNMTVAPFTMKGRCVETYHLDTKVRLHGGVGLYDIVQIFRDKKFIDKCVVDITVTGKLKGGLKKTMTKKDVPLKKLLNYADKKL